MNTRDQIRDAAWELYSARGFEDVSVRDVTQAAGVNLASVSYHYGGKDGLVQEVVQRCMNSINRHRMELIENQIERFGGFEKLSLHAVILAFFRPLVMPEECGVPSALILRLAARYLIQPDYQVPAESRELHTETCALFVKALKLHFPESSAEEILKQLIYISGAAIYVRVQQDMEKYAVDDMESSNNDVDREQSLTDLIEFAIRGFGGDTDEAVAHS